MITNDFPPRIGGIESFLADVCGLLDDQVVVYTATAPGAAAFDAAQPYPVIRDRGPLLPTPHTARRAASLLREWAADRVIFGAAAPLALLAGTLRAAGARRMVALTHGHEVWWATVPGARQLLRRIGEDVDHLTVISDFTAARIGRALSPAARARMLRVPPPVHPAPARTASGASRPRCIAVGRLVVQKGFDTLLHAWRRVLNGWLPHRETPELVVVGDGPQRRRLLGLAARLGLSGTVTWTGALPRADVRRLLQAADVFALPVRTRLGGLNPEGLGLAALEAAACGLPVVVGASGGAPETVRPGQTGFLVDPDDAAGLAERVSLLLTDPELARRLGGAGRTYVARSFGAPVVGATLRRALDLGWP